MTLLFTKEEAEKAYNSLAQLVRRISYGLNITSDKYTQLHSMYYKRHGHDPALVTSNRNNTRKSITLETPTWKASWFYICEILKYDIVSLTITIRDRETEEEYTFSTSDPVPDQPGQAKPNKKSSRSHLRVVADNSDKATQKKTETDNRPIYKVPKSK